jgi:integrase
MVNCAGLTVMVTHHVTQNERVTMRNKLTENSINEQAKLIAPGALQRIELADDNVEGLRLRIGLKGKVWSLMCRTPDGGIGRFKLGSHPSMNVTAARIAAKRLREKVRDGFNPIAAKKADRARAIAEKEAAKRLAMAEANALTLRGLFDLYEKMGRRKDLRRPWTLERQGLERTFSGMLDMPLEQITLKDMQIILDRKYADAPYRAVWMKRNLSPIFKWASAPGRAYVGDEFTKLSVPMINARRERILEGEELSRVLVAIRNDAGNPYSDCAMFILLTCLRRSEAEGLEWNRVDFDKRTAFVGMTKNGKPHTMPLSNQAYDLLMRRKQMNGSCNLVFPSQRETVLANWDRWLERMYEATGTDGWHRHDLRRTSATLMGNIDIDPYVIEAALNHTYVAGQLAQNYNKSTYRPKVSDALQRLGNHLDAL